MRQAAASSRSPGAHPRAAFLPQILLEPLTRGRACVDVAIAVWVRRGLGLQARDNTARIVPFCEVILPGLRESEFISTQPGYGAFSKFRGSTEIFEGEHRDPCSQACENMFFVAFDIDLDEDRFSMLRDQIIQSRNLNIDLSNPPLGRRRRPLVRERRVPCMRPESKASAARSRSERQFLDGNRWEMPANFIGQNRVGLHGDHPRPELQERLGVVPSACADIEHERAGRDELS